MRNLAGIALILAGVSIGIYAMLSDKDAGARTSPRPILADASASVPAPVAKDLRSAQAPAADPPKTVTIAEVPARVPLVQYTASFEPPPDSFTLAREIQIHLKRVGCYQGKIDGVWSPSVSRSMKAFIAHANAALPVEDPDIILLALLKSHRDRACGAPCPARQTLADNGHCLPHAVIGRATKKKTPTDSDLIRTSIAAPRAAIRRPTGEPPAKGRMSLGGSSLALTSKSQKPARKSSRRTAYTQARAREAWQQSVSPYDRYPRWAARAFLQHN